MAKFISLFAGVGGFDLGMEQAGHECVAQVEWDKNAAGVLKHRWPNVPLFCDVSKVSADDLPDADFITYGFPCQDLSVAGKREGLDGKRSGLFYEATRLIRELRTRGCGLRFAVAENVGGLFSADDGVALARCLRELLDSGACETGWRLLDSQYFGVAQRRKRVFIVSDFGGESVDEILAITESLPGYPAPSREAGKGTAGDATKGVGEGLQDVVGTLCNADHKGAGNQYVNDNKVIVEGVDWYNNAVTELKQISPTLKAETKQGDTEVNVLQGGEGVGVAHSFYPTAGRDFPIEKELSLTVKCGSSLDIPSPPGVLKENLTVRRLTPIECERLQGFPDNWTSEKMELILEGNEWKASGKVAKQADGPRYKQMGNAITVNVGAWIGKQIGKVLS
jgi:DNA (cytosine-5)-methyltransferase 1